jgi:hypothetical protein
VENKVKAKKQAERRLHQKVNTTKQRSEGDQQIKNKKRRGRGAIQREQKRQKRSTGEDKTDVIRAAHTKALSSARNTEGIKAEKGGPQKRAMRPLKQKKARDTAEKQLDEIVHNHQSNRKPKEEVNRKPATEKRWFE